MMVKSAVLQETSDFCFPGQYVSFLANTVSYKQYVWPSTHVIAKHTKSISIGRLLG